MTSGTLHPSAPSSNLMASTPSIAVAADGPPAAKTRFWDKVARKYAADPIADMAGYEATLARTRERLSPTHRVLEIGCGTGTTALRLAPCTGHFVATDVSPGMIAIAREKLAAAPQPNLEFLVADADAPVFGQAAYDVVLAFNLLHLVADLDAALTAAVDALADMNPLVPRLLLPAMRLFGKAPPALCFREPALHAAITRHGLDILAVEHHGTKGKDIRPFIVARKRGTADGRALPGSPAR
jgi:SAM-dependent methyltransferase